MERELLKKAKQSRRRRWMILAVVLFLALGALAGLKITGGGSLLPAGDQKAVMEITCSQVTEDPSVLKRPELMDYLPKDGVILDKTTYHFKKGATVYDALADLCKQKKIHMESKFDSVYQSYYVKGISHLYEFDAGKRSGWLFRVNGEMADYGANQVKLKEGDQILWYYVVDYTKE